MFVHVHYIMITVRKDCIYRVIQEESALLWEIIV
jgi:hypothetical protein